METAAEEIEDAYRFGPVLGDLDAYLFGEGTHLRLYDVMGAHVRTIDGVDGTAFAVWAPNARRVSVVGDFNDWDGRRHPMRLRLECGVWEIFVPGVGAGARYKYELERSAGDAACRSKSDPLAFYAERAPRNASIVCDAAAARVERRRVDERPRRAPAARRADLDLRSASRFVARGPRKATAFSPIANSPTS